MEKESVIVDKARALSVIKTAVEAKRKALGIFEKIKYPEEDFVELMMDWEKRERIDNLALNALFLLTPLVRGDNTQYFFNRLLKNPLLRENRWIFIPRSVVEAENRGMNVVGVCKDTLRPGGYAIKYLNQWSHNCQFLTDKYLGDTREFLRENNDNAEVIVKKLIVRPRVKTKDKPGLRGFGPKIAVLAAQWINKYFVKLANAEKIGVPVDFQISRILVQTESVDIALPQQAYQLTQKVILPLIKEMCSEEGISPEEVSESMWYLGSQCCNKGRFDLCPISEMCVKVISRRPYDKDGLIDPKDKK